MMSASAYTAGSVLWLRNLVVEIGNHVEGKDTWRETDTWRATSGKTADENDSAGNEDRSRAATATMEHMTKHCISLLVREPVMCTVVLFLSICALSDVAHASGILPPMEGAPWTPSDMSTPSPARSLWIEQWMLWLPGAMGAVSYMAGSMIQMIYTGDADVSARKDVKTCVVHPQSAPASRHSPSDYDRSCVDAMGSFSDLCSTVDAAEDDRDLCGTPPYMRVAVMASCARLVQGPLHMMVSFFFLDQSCLEAAAALGARDFCAAAANVLDSASEVTSIAAQASIGGKVAAQDIEASIVTNGLADIESLRDELFCHVHSAQGVPAASTDAFSSSHSIAHVVVGVLFLIASVAWLVELYAERRLGGKAQREAERISLKGRPKEATLDAHATPVSSWKNPIGAKVESNRGARTLGKRLATYGKGIMLSQLHLMRNLRK